MSILELDYCELLNDILANGTHMDGRNGGCTFLTGCQIRFDASKVPLLTKRKIYYKGVFGEIAAFFKGPSRLSDFENEGCNYWKNWADSDGSIRVDYGNKWLNFNGKNQLEQLISDLETQPNSRRMIISSWDPSAVDNLSLPCCHYAYQFIVRGNKLDMVWVQRSVDTAIGLPSDFMLAWAMLLVIANQSGYEMGNIIMQLGHVHVYDNHINQVRKYLCQPQHQLPTYKLDKSTSIYDFKADHIKIENYVFSPSIKFEINA
tara:strand:+ start:5504 stop:6286 length:783 start_codon:yes stop_codon:yes gene_type:complete